MQQDKSNQIDRPQRFGGLRACVRRVLECTGTATAFAFACATALAAPGDLDPTFGVGGIRTLNFATDAPNSHDEARAMLRQPDGKLLIAGDNGQSRVIIRLDTAGNLDPTWGIGGKRTVDIDTAIDFTLEIGDEGIPAYVLALDASGNVYVAGRSLSAGSFDFAIIKLDASGNMVPGFGAGGKKTIDVDNSDDTARGLALDASGNVYLAGKSCAASCHFAVVKLDANGNLVPSFGAGGKLIDTSVSSAGPLVLDANGNAYVTGDSPSAGPLVVKLDANGNLVPSFGAGGKSSTGIGVNALALDASGNVYGAGGSSGDFAVVKLDANGNLLPSFGTGGKKTIDFSSGNDWATALAVDAGGNVYLAGTASGSSLDFAVVKLDANGNLVPGFGAGGKQAIDVGNNSADWATALALDPSGNIYVAGSSTGPGGYDFAVVKLDANGNRVPDFGQKSIDIGGNSEDAAKAVALDAAGNIFLAGAGGARAFALTKLDTNGNLVPSFGVGGKQRIDIGANSAANALVVDQNGNLVIAGSSGFPKFEMVVIKLDANGNLLPSFGVGGKQIINFDARSSDVANALALDASGNIYVAGASSSIATYGYFDFAVIKLDANGNLVPGFGAGGKVTTDVGGCNPNNIVPIALDASGNVYLGGTYSSCTFQGFSDFAVVKLDANGNLVPSFGVGGKKTIDIGNNSSDVASALALDAGGNVILAGTNGGGFAVVKLDANGNLLPSFGAGGKKTIDIGNDAKALALDTSGNIYVAGTSANASGNSDFTVVKLDANGNLVPSFGTGGKVLADINRDDAANALALDASGRALVAGWTRTRAGDKDFAVIRLQGDQAPPASALTSPVFRFFNTAVGTHFYTVSTAERDSIQNTLPQYRYEGAAFNAYTSQVNGSAPVYRFFNTATATHFYTINEAEKNNIVATLPTFHFEGPAYYAYPTQLAGTSAVYRFFNTLTNTHFYTISAAERDNVINALPQYRYEGPAYYAAP